MIEKIVIENLVNRYHQYWQQSDIDGLMSMYDKEITHHDMPSGDVMRYQDMKKFLPVLSPQSKIKALNSRTPHISKVILPSYTGNRVFQFAARSEG